MSYSASKQLWNILSRDSPGELRAITIASKICNKDIYGKDQDRNDIRKINNCIKFQVSTQHANKLFKNWTHCQI